MATTPYLVATFGAAAGGTLNPAIFPSVATNDSDAIHVGCLCTAGTVTGVEDTQGNTYTLLQSEVTNSGCQIYHFAAYGTNPLALSDTITPTYSSNSSAQGIVIVGDPNVQGSDKTVGNTNTTGATASIATGILAQIEEHVIGFVADLAAGGSPALGGGLTSLGSVEAGSTAFIAAGYNVVNSTASTTPSGTFTSTTWSISVVTNEVNPVTIVSTPPTGIQGVPYSSTLSSTGGVSPYTYTLVSGSLPTGVNLSTATIQGTPSVNGTFNFTIRATDAHGITEDVPFTVIIYPNVAGLAPYTPIPHNILSASDADFESGSITWKSYLNTNTPAVTTSISATGNKSLTYTATGTTIKVIAGPYKIQPGMPHISALLLMTARNANSFLQVDWHDSAGNFITSQEGPVTQSVGGIWQPLYMNGFSPTTGASFYLIVETDNVQVGDVQYIDFASALQTDAQILIDWVNPVFSPDAFAGNQFLDVSGFIRYDQEITITRGRTDGISEVGSGTANFQLQNDSGLFTRFSTSSIAPIMGGFIDLQRRCQINIADELGVWHTRFDGPISEIEYTGENTGNTNVASITVSDVLAFMNRDKNLLCWTREQIHLNGPQWHWPMDDAGNAAGNGLAAETSGNNGAPLRPRTSDSSNTATIGWQDSSGGIEILANAVKAKSLDGSEFWSDGTIQPSSALRGLDSGVQGPFSTPSPLIYLTPKISPTSIRNDFVSNIGYSLSTTVPNLRADEDGSNFAIEMWFTCDPGILAGSATLIGPFIQLSLVNSKTQYNVLAGIFLTGNAIMNYSLKSYNQPPAYSIQNFSSTGVATPLASISTSFTPDTVQLPHHLVINSVGSAAGGSMIMYLDGVQIGTLPLVKGSNFDTIIVGADWGGVGCHWGGVQLLSVYPYNLDSDQITEDCMLGQYGMWEQTTDNCISQLASYAVIPGFWNNLSDQSLGLSMTDYLDINGSSALSAMQIYEQTEQGLLFVNAQGQLTFHTRDWRMGYPGPDLILEPDTFDANMALNLVDQFQCNEQAVSSAAFATGAATINIDSQNQYGTYATNQVGSPIQLAHISWSRAYGQLGLSGLYYWPDPNMQDFCSWAANSRDTPWLIPSQITIDMLTVSESFTSLALSDIYALEIGSMISPGGNLPKSFPNVAFSTEWFIEGITEVKSQSTHTFEFATSAAETQRAWKPGDTTYGVLGVSTRIGVSAPDVNPVIADGKDVSHDAGFPYWAPSVTATMNNPSQNGHGFIGGNDVRGWIVNLSTSLEPPICVVSAQGNNQNIVAGAQSNPMVLWDYIHVDSVSGMGAIPNYPNWYVCLVPGFYEIDVSSIATNNATSGAAWQGWIVVAMQAAQAIMAGSGTPLTVSQYVCPIGETVRINNSGSINPCASPTTRIYLGLGDMVGLATESNINTTTGTGNGGSHMSIIFKGYANDDDRVQINSSLASGGTIVTPSTGGVQSIVYNNFATYTYYGTNAKSGRENLRENTNTTVYQGCASGNTFVTGSQYAQISYKNANIIALAGHTIKSASLQCTNVFAGNGVFTNLLVGVYYNVSGGNKWVPSEDSRNIRQIIAQNVLKGQKLNFTIPTEIIVDLATGANGLFIGNNSTLKSDNYGGFVGGPGTWKLFVTYI